MADIRTPTTGTYFNGNAVGDVPTWNGVEWLAQPGAPLPAPAGSEYGGAPVPVPGPAPAQFSVVLPGFAQVPVVSDGVRPTLIQFSVNRSHTVDPGFQRADYVLLVDGGPVLAVWSGAGAGDFNTVSGLALIVLPAGPHSIDVQVTPATSGAPGSGEAISHASLVVQA